MGPFKKKIFRSYIHATLSRLPFCIRILITKWKDEPLCACSSPNFLSHCSACSVSSWKSIPGNQDSRCRAHTVGLLSLIQSITCLPQDFSSEAIINVAHKSSSNCSIRVDNRLITWKPYPYSLDSVFLL